MMGVDYELFWKLNPKSLSPFVKAFSLKQKYQDTMAWQSGQYIKLAITSSFNKESKYPNKPFMSVEKEKPAVCDSEAIKSRMFSQMEILNKRFRKED
jgi:hypothetical protein